MRKYLLILTLGLSLTFLASSCKNNKLAVSHPDLTSTEELEQVEDSTPSFSIVTASVKEIQDRFEPGKINIVYVWSRTCGVCLRSMPSLTELDAANSNLNIFFLNIDNDPDFTISFFEGVGYQKPVFFANSKYGRNLAVKLANVRSELNGNVQPKVPMGFPTSFVFEGSKLLSVQNSVKTDWVNEQLEKAASNN